MKDNKLIKFLIPLVAAVVIFESVVLVTSLEKGTKQVVNDNNVATDSAEVVDQEKIESPVASFVFSTDTSEMKVGKSYKVTLNLLPKESKTIGAIETYIKYDAKNLKIANLVSTSKLQKPAISKIDSENGMIKNIILIDDKGGVELVANNLLPVLTFEVTPKTEGDYTLELGYGNESKEFVTLVVENTTAKSLVWTDGKLDINVIK